MQKILEEIFGDAIVGAWAGVPNDGSVLKDIARARATAEAEGVEVPPRPEIEASVRLITPAIAQALLDNMMPNRNESRRHIYKLASDMETGRFYATNQGIGILEDGLTADGQHRLRAIIESGKPQWMVVVTGLKKDAVLAIDRNRARTVANFLQIMQRGQATVLASSANVVLKAEEAWAGPTKITTAQSLTFSDFAVWDRAEEIAERMDVDALAEATRKLNVKSLGGPGIAPSVGGAFYYLAKTHYGGEEVDEFVEEVRGVNTRPGKASFVLRNKVEELKRRKARQLEYLAFVIWAFTKYVSDRETGAEEDHKMLRPTRDGLLPEMPERA